MTVVLDVDVDTVTGRMSIPEPFLPSTRQGREDPVGDRGTGPYPGFKDEINVFV